MNFQQMEYVLAIDKERHFAKAAAKCFVTQPTLSMMVQKLEEELGVKLFERDRKPVLPTKAGEEIIRRIRIILLEAKALKECAAEMRGTVTGTLRLGIIPTLAPYLLPLFLKSFAASFPTLQIYIQEMVTDEMIIRIKSGDIDIGLVATPLFEEKLEETELFQEEFFAYVSSANNTYSSQYLLPSQIDINELWLLEEGHCFRNQILKLCELKKSEQPYNALHYESGSIETLINLVDSSDGVTIIPSLAVRNLRTEQKKRIRQFSEPKPGRQISLITLRDYPRKQITASLKAEILAHLPPEILAADLKPVQVI